MLSDELVQIIKFGMVGVWNTVFSLSLFWIFYKIFKKSFKTNILPLIPIKIEAISQALSFIIANIVSYWLNSRFTFGNTSDSGSSFALYVLISLISMVISSGIMQLFSTKHNFKKFSTLAIKKLPSYTPKYDHFVFLVNICSIVAVMIINYLGYKYLVFN